MFGALKAKLKNWIRKNKEPVETPKSKPKKKITKKKPKDELELSIEKILETPSKEKGFFVKFKKRLTEEKFNELIEELEIIL